MGKHKLYKNRTARWLGTCLAVCSPAAAHAAVVINEIDYDQPGSDVAEFIELYNGGNTPVFLEGYSLDLINGSSGSVYRSLDLSGSSIEANGYLVLCGDAAAVFNCTIETGSSSWIQNGGPAGDAIALLSSGAVIDSVVYEAGGGFLGGYAEGGSVAGGDSNSVQMGIGRLPDGVDSNDNAGDFDTTCLTPGSTNIGGTGDCAATVSPVPVPAAVWLFGSGLIGILAVGRRRRRV